MKDTIGFILVGFYLVSVIGYMWVMRHNDKKGAETGRRLPPEFEGIRFFILVCPGINTVVFVGTLIEVFKSRS